jgi:hypothetical protein
LGTTALGWGNLFLATTKKIDWANGNVTLTHATGLLTVAGGGLKLAAGTTAIAPLTLQSGTNLTTATAGSTEYDGKVQYFTPAGTQRGVVPAALTYRLNAAFAGTNVATAQPIFNVGATLTASTVYKFEMVLTLSKSAGTTSHTVGLSFGGTATINNCSYNVLGGLIAGATPTGINTTFYNAMSNVATTTVVTGAIATAAISISLIITGTISINAAGTLIPQYICSAAPGGAYSTNIGSIITLYPIGTAGLISVGNWA